MENLAATAPAAELPGRYYKLIEAGHFGYSVLARAVLFSSLKKL